MMMRGRDALCTVGVVPHVVGPAEASRGEGRRAVDEDVTRLRLVRARLVGRHRGGATLLQRRRRRRRSWSGWACALEVGEVESEEVQQAVAAEAVAGRRSSIRLPSQLRVMYTSPAIAGSVQVLACARHASQHCCALSTLKLMPQLSEPPLKPACCHVDAARARNGLWERACAVRQ